MMPMRSGSTPISLARLRTRLTARWPSCAAESHTRSLSNARPGTVYLSTIAVTPMELNHVGDLRAFQVVGEDVVSTAGRDDDGGAGTE